VASAAADPRLCRGAESIFIHHGELLAASGDARPNVVALSSLALKVAVPPGDLSADLNHDGAVDGRDIESLVRCISDSGAGAVGDSRTAADDGIVGQFVDRLIGR